MRSSKSGNRRAREALLEGIGVPERLDSFTPDAFQQQAIDSLSEKKDTLVIAPTGAGKTFIAIEGIRHILERGERAIYTAPLKALSNTKFVEFQRTFEPSHKVGLMTGDRKIETHSDIVVATTEIYRNDLYNYGESYSLVVLDELHYMADPQRGPVWEESIILAPNSATLLMLSASVSNADEIAAWIEEIRGKAVTVIIETERPVELRLGFLHPEQGVLPLADEKGEVFEEVEKFYRESTRQPPGYGRFVGRRGKGSGKSRRRR